LNLQLLKRPGFFMGAPLNVGSAAPETVSVLDWSGLNMCVSVEEIALRRATVPQVALRSPVRPAAPA
jgi:hypothetical protein